MISLTILGEPASKANSRKLVTLRNRPAFIKSEKARDFEVMAQLQIPASARVMLEGELKATIRIFYASERPDLDESVVLDVLQAKFQGKGKQRACVRRGVYLNDRKVRERHVYHGIDRKNPRVEIEIEPRFAAQAMAALFDSDAGHSAAEVVMIAQEAYDMADAMLRERERMGE
jgi:Holliday junction resolvase RusA-like endonuclease